MAKNQREPRVTFLRFNAPSRHRLLAYGREIYGGELFDLPEHLAAALAADPNNNVSIVEHVDVEHEPEADDGEGHDTDPQDEQEE